MTTALYIRAGRYGLREMDRAGYCVYIYPARDYLRKDGQVVRYRSRTAALAAAEAFTDAHGERSAAVRFDKRWI